MYLVFRFSTSALVTAVAAATASLRLFSGEKKNIYKVFYMYVFDGAMSLGQE